MTHPKRKASLLYLILAVFLALTGCAAAEKVALHMAVLKGPTGMGAAWLMEENEAGRAANQYTFTVAGAPDALVSQFVTGELDMAALPTNTIALLSAKTDGAVQALAVNTLGVLYLLERGDSVETVADLAGKTIVVAGQGTTVEAIVGRLFGDGVTVDYVAEHAEAVAMTVAGKYDLVLLPEPFVTSATKQNADLRVALNLTTLWEESCAGALPMGGIAVRRDFADKHPDAVRAFLDEYAKSVAYANENPSEAAQLIQKFDIMQATVAESAIPRSNMVFMTGAEMKEALTGFYTVLLGVNPTLIGGTLPQDSFYYAP